MYSGLVSVSYVVASILFILSLGGLGHQETARRGNLYGIAGIIIAVGATLFHNGDNNLVGTLVAIAMGAIAGLLVAQRVVMTQMPQLVAILHSFVGLAAVLVGCAGYVDPLVTTVGAGHTIKLVEVYVGIFVGAVTFTGSIVACGKLHGSITSKPVMLTGRHWLNIAISFATIVLGGYFLSTDDMAFGITMLVVMAAMALLLGVSLLMVSGGVDMRVGASCQQTVPGWWSPGNGLHSGK